MDKKVLLIADDVEMNRNVIKKFLSRDFAVLEAENGKEAIDYIRTQKIDALLLDIVMPVMDGLQVLEILNEQKLNPTMGILVATSTKEKTERRALSLGADDVVSKPYDPVIIKKRLDNIMLIKSIESSLNSNNNLSFINQRMRKSLETMQESIDTLCKVADIIEANMDNRELMMEMASRIQKEAKKMTKIIDI